MTRIVEIETKRLLLKQWREDDLADFALLNSDPEVMGYLPKLLISISPKTLETSHDFRQKNNKTPINQFLCISQRYPKSWIISTGTSAEPKPCTDDL